MATNKDNDDKRPAEDAGGTPAPEDTPHSGWQEDPEPAAPERREGETTGSGEEGMPWREDRDSNWREPGGSTRGSGGAPGEASADEEDDEEPEETTRYKAKSQPIGIIGFSASGKTVYLSMLYHATAERKVFRAGWHANWASQDNGETKKYLQDISRRIRGFDARGRVLFENPDAPTRVVRSFPPGTVWNTPIRFELLRKWGLRGRSLLVHTEDGVGEVIGQAALHGPENLPQEFRTRWQNTMELCRHSRALLLFINLLNIEEVEVAPDVAFLIDCLIKDGVRPRAVSFVATGLDAWAGRKDVGELRATLEESFHNVFASLDRAKIPWELHLVSSLGENFARKRTDNLAEGCRAAGHICNLCQEITSDPRARPLPRAIDEPWEFIFRRCLPLHSRVAPSAVFVDILAILREKLINRYTIPAYATAAVLFFAVLPFIQGERTNNELAEYMSAEMPALVSNAAGPGDTWEASHASVREAHGRFGELRENRVWPRLRAEAAEEAERNLNRLGSMKRLLAAAADPAPDYAALVDGANAYNARFGGDEAHRALPVAEWTFRRDERRIADATTPLAERIAAARNLIEDFPDRVADLAATARSILADTRQWTEDVQRRFDDVPPDFQDLESVEGIRAEAGAVKRELQDRGILAREFGGEYGSLIQRIEDIENYLTQLAGFARLNQRFTADAAPDLELAAMRFNQLYESNRAHANEWGFLFSVFDRALQIERWATEDIQDRFDQLPPSLPAAEGAEGFAVLRAFIGDYEEFINHHDEGEVLVRRARDLSEEARIALARLAANERGKVQERILRQDRATASDGPPSLREIEERRTWQTALRNEKRRASTYVPDAERAPIRALARTLDDHEEQLRAHRRLRELLDAPTGDVASLEQAHNAFSALGRPDDSWSTDERQRWQDRHDRSAAAMREGAQNLHATVRALRSLADAHDERPDYTGFSRHARAEAGRLETKARRWDARNLLALDPDLQAPAGTRTDDQIRDLQTAFHSFLGNPQFSEFDDLRAEAARRRAGWFEQITDDALYYEELRRFIEPEARTSRTGELLAGLQRDFSRFFSGSEHASDVAGLSLAVSGAGRSVTVRTVPDRIRLPRRLSGDIACALLLVDPTGARSVAAEWSGTLNHSDTWPGGGEGLEARRVSVPRDHRLVLRIRIGGDGIYRFESEQEFPALVTRDSALVMEVLEDRTSVRFRIDERTER